MISRYFILVAAVLFTTASTARTAVAQNLEPPPAICANDAGWVENDADRIAGRFAEAFVAFDREVTDFSARFTRAFGTEGSIPDAGARAALRGSVTGLRRSLSHLLPASEPDNTGGPLMFSLDQLSGRNDAEDRDEVLRAAFVREMASISMPRPQPDISGFPAVLEMTESLLDRSPGTAISAHDSDTLHFLAGGSLAESYDIDFRRPARRVLEERWHTSLASRLRWQVRSLCEEAGA